MAGDFLMVAARVNELKLERDSTKGEDPEATRWDQGGATRRSDLTKPRAEKVKEWRKGR